MTITASTSNSPAAQAEAKLMRFLLGASLSALLCAVLASAQMRGGVGAPAPAPGITIGFSPRVPQRALRNNFIPGAFYPDAWLGDYYSPVPQQPSVVVVQPPAPAPVAH